MTIKKYNKFLNIEVRYSCEVRAVPS